MPTLAQQFREEFREEFMETLGPQLRAEGKAEGKEDIALRMLKRGFDLDTIVDITGLTKSEIEALSSQVESH